MKTQHYFLMMFIALVLMVSNLILADSMGTAFTYQGRLLDDNIAADGLYDIQFKLYDDPNILTATQIGDIVMEENVDVMDGYFITELDFGSDPNGFNGDARWLQVIVRPGTSVEPNDFVALEPLQPLHPTPYAVYAAGSDWNNLANIPAGFADDVDDVGITAETDPTVPSSIKDGVSWGEVDDRPLGLDDGDDVGITSESDPTVPAYVKDGIEWSEVTARPAGLDDGDDDTHLSETDVDTYVANNGYLIDETDPTVPESVKDGIEWIEVMDIPEGFADGVDDVGAMDTDWEIADSNMFSGVLGNVGIGTTSPGDKLDVSGHINATESYKLDGATVLSNPEPNSIFVGEGAGVNNTTGSYNSAVGTNALSANTTGYSNSAMGYGALYSNTTGYLNTAMGDQALLNNTDGNNNTAMGGIALASNTEGHSNSAVGSAALSYNTTGSHNSAVGFQALLANTEGHNNSAMGADALVANTTGYGNSAMGSGALNANTEGFYNSAMGTSALNANTTGYHNSAVGNNALFANTTGYGNSAVGYHALFVNTDGDSNTAIGDRAGYFCEGSGNVFIGNKAGFHVTDSNNLLYIENSDSSSPLIYGEFDNDLVAINGDLQVTNQLKISGGSPDEGKVLTSDADGLGRWETPAAVSDSDWTISGSDMFSGVLGNVGIGIPSPNDKLDVSGHINATESYKLDGITVLNQVGDNLFVGDGAGVNNTEGSHNSAVGTDALKANTTGIFNSAVGSQALYANTEGVNNTAMGVGALMSNETGFSNSAVGIQALAANTEGWGNIAVGHVAGYNSTGDGNVFIGYAAGYDETGSNKLYIENSDSSSPLIYGEFDNDLVAINGQLKVTGDVGIGIDNPAAKLEVDGIISAFRTGTSGVIQVNDKRVADGKWNLYADNGDFHINESAAANADRMYFKAGGNVGIGTTNPARKLHVSDVMRLEPRASAPTTDVSEGDMYMDSTTHKLMVFDGTTWQACW